jgi:thioredoxin-like negative regulator of GroEL
MANKTVNGIKINFFEVDCDSDPATAEKFNVKGYPTIKMLKGNQIIEYDAKPSKDTLTEFVNTTLG